MQLNRRQRKAMAKEHAEYFRVIPYFQDEKGEVVAGVQTYVLHTPPKDWIVATLPAAAVSIEYARAKEQELTKATGKDVIVLSHQVKFLRVERMTPQDVACLMPKTAPVQRPAASAPPDTGGS